jgi:DNA modification methylase
MASYEVMVGDCLEELKKLPSNHFHSCITSPPYFGLRDYGEEGQIGLEESLDGYIDALVGVCRELKRVLRDDGTFWLNLGDSYNGSGGAGGDYNKGGKKEGQPRYKGRDLPDFKRKDLLLVPHRVAIALQADGWFVRQDVVWAKPNPMPEPANDRCARNHEYLFLLTKQPSYYFDWVAIQEDAITQANSGRNQASTKHYGEKNGGNGGLKKFKDKFYSKGQFPTKRRKKSVWWIPTKAFKGAHFATFPPELVEPCILTTPTKVCGECGRGYDRVPPSSEVMNLDEAKARRSGKSTPDSMTHEFEKSCECETDSTSPARIIDIFGGSGTTAGVAIRSGRDCTLIELNSEYASLIPRRVETIVGYKLDEGESMPTSTDFGEWFD